jgi:hypothetical protein
MEELFMSISEMEEYVKENPHIQIAPAAPAIVSGVNIEQKMDTGWKETLQKISEAHPNSALADRYGNNKTLNKKKVKECTKNTQLNKRKKRNNINMIMIRARNFSTTLDIKVSSKRGCKLLKSLGSCINGGLLHDNPLLYRGY